MELQRRAADVKDDDPIIPFGSLPTVSRLASFHARLNLATRQTVRCHPCLTLPNTPVNSSCFVSALLMGQQDYFVFLMVFVFSFEADYTYANHSGWSGDSYQPHQTSQGHFSERYVALPCSLQAIAWFQFSLNL